MTQLCWLGRTLKKYWTTGEQRTSFNSSRAVRCDVSRFVLCSIINLIVSVITFWLYMRFLHIAHPHTSPFLHDVGHLRCKNNVYLCFLIVQRHSEWREEEELWPVHVTWPLVIIILVNDPLFALSQLLFVDFLHSDRQETFCLTPFRSSPLPKYVFTSRSQSSLEVSVVSNKSWCSIIIWNKDKKKSKTPWQLCNFHPYLPVELGRFPSERPDNKRAAN